MAAAYGKDGKVDWEKFYEIVKDYDVTLFDPPQKKAQWAAKMRNINIFTPRSPWCRGFPCCLAECVQSYTWCQGHNIQHMKISEPDQWFMDMMEPPTGENQCPEFLRGVWWMKDNVANENLVSLESARWEFNGTVGWKNGFVNWTTGSSLAGSVLLYLKKYAAPVLQIDTLKKKWISFSRDESWWRWLKSEAERCPSFQAKTS